MNPSQFALLHFGNVLRGPDGKLYLVQQVVRDANNNAEFVGIIPAIDAAAAVEYKVVSDRPCETFLKDRTVNNA